MLTDVLRYKNYDNAANVVQKFYEENLLSSYPEFSLIQHHPEQSFKLDDLFIITGTDDCSMLCELLEKRLLIYSGKWNNEIVKALSDEIQFDDHLFGGRKDLVVTLFNQNKIEYEILKERIVFECNRVNKDFKLSRGKFGMARTEDLVRVCELIYYFNGEVFEDNVSKNYRNILRDAKIDIHNEELFTWEVDSEITSIVRIVNPTKGLPVIDLLYTGKESRNCGFGSSLLFFVTNYLLKNGYRKCQLVSDIKNSAIEKIGNPVGYKNIGEIISARKRK